MAVMVTMIVAAYFVYVWSDGDRHTTATEGDEIGAEPYQNFGLRCRVVIGR